MQDTYGHFSIKIKNEIIKKKKKKKKKKTRNKKVTIMNDYDDKIKYSIKSRLP